MKEIKKKQVERNEKDKKNQPHKFCELAVAHVSHVPYIILFSDLRETGKDNDGLSIRCNQILNTIKYPCFTVT